MTNADFPMPPPMDAWKIWDDLSARQSLELNWTRQEPRREEVDLRRGVALVIDLPDPESLLDSAVSDLRETLSSTELLTEKPSGYRITAYFDGDMSQDNESYQIEIGADKCILHAGEIEGMRRAVYHFEEMLLASDGPFLRRRTVKAKAWLKNRISRSLLYPTNRPPQNLNGLDNDIDYFPDGYLSRLAREGTNALWLEINFKDVCKTFLYPESSGMERRLSKLRAIVEKCRHYGIKIFVLGIEPVGIRVDDPVLEKYPELAGFNWGLGLRSFCPSTENGKRYLYEASNWLFSQVPNLGGMINITLGEACSSCLHCGQATDPNPALDDRRCPRCSKLPPREVLGNILTPMRQGMISAAPKAELICWFYHSGSETTAMPWVHHLEENMPDRVGLLYNFESGLVVEQAGKPRLAGDYWQSQAGPSARFINMAGLVRSSGREVAAKIQVANSHEIASVPMVPVPGILFSKYLAMHSLGVSSVMQCWYFGGSPGLMNRAAGRLAFCDFDLNEDEFLRDLALPEWRDAADLVALAWKKFAYAYSFYPVSKVFQYFGPMHNGITWPLFLEPRFSSLSPNWLASPPGGDAIGECLCGFTIEEAAYLCRRMAENWREGLVCLRQAVEKTPGDERRLDLNLAKAIGVLFESGSRILRFYLLRDRLFSNAENKLEIMDEMTAIVRSEISADIKILSCCELDSRLGYNSEAETYKFYPELIIWRRNQLESLLEDEFPRVRRRLSSGGKLCDIERVLTNSYQCDSGWHEQETFRWRVDQMETSLRFVFERNRNGWEKDFDLDQICMLFGDVRALTFPFFLIFRKGVGVKGNVNREFETTNVEGDGVWRGSAEIPFELLPSGFPGCEIAFNIFRQYFEEGGMVFDSWGKVSCRGFCFCCYDPAGMGRILSCNVKQ